MPLPMTDIGNGPQWRPLPISCYCPLPMQVIRNGYYHNTRYWSWLLVTGIWWWVICNAWLVTGVLPVTNVNICPLSKWVFHIVSIRRCHFPSFSSTVLTLEKCIILSFWHAVFLHHLDLEMSTKTCSTIWLVQSIMLPLITKIKLKQKWHMRSYSLQSCLYILCWPLIELVCQSCVAGAYGGDREQCGR
jgi:hypothetical protein